jgi:hypothetical protein
MADDPVSTCDGIAHLWVNEGEGHALCDCGAVRHSIETRDGWRHTEILEPLKGRVLLGFAACKKCDRPLYLCTTCKPDAARYKSFVCYHCCAAGTCSKPMAPDPVTQEEYNRAIIDL